MQKMSEQIGIFAKLRGYRQNRRPRQGWELPGIVIAGGFHAGDAVALQFPEIPEKGSGI
jgi:hypothetical protein